MSDLERLIAAVEAKCAALRANAHKAGKEGKGTHRNAGDGGRVATLYIESCHELATLRALSARVVELEAEREAAMKSVEDNWITQVTIEEANADNAARVLAAIDTALIEELVAAGNVMANALRGDYIVPGSAGKWFAALAKMNGGQQ
jgi:hypothetical protein